MTLSCQGRRGYSDTDGFGMVLNASSSVGSVSHAVQTKTYRQYIFVFLHGCRTPPPNRTEINLALRSLQKPLLAHTHQSCKTFERDWEAQNLILLLLRKPRSISLIIRLNLWPDLRYALMPASKPDKAEAKQQTHPGQTCPESKTAQEILLLGQQLVSNHESIALVCICNRGAGACQFWFCCCLWPCTSNVCSCSPPLKAII